MQTALRIRQKIMLRLPASGRANAFGGVLLANILSNAASFAITIHAARSLGPDRFGTFALAISLTSVLAIVFDFGLSITFVREFKQHSTAQGEALARGIFAMKIVTLIFAVFTATFRNAIANLFLPGRDAGNLILSAVVSAAMLSLWMSVRSYEQAHGTFTRFSQYTVAYALLRFAVYLGFLVTGRINEQTAMLSLYAVPLAILLPAGWIQSRPQHKLGACEGAGAVYNSLGNTLRYGFWVALSSIVYMLTSRAPQFFLAHSGNQAALGLFSAALTFTTGFALLNDSIRTILLPEVAMRQSMAERTSFRKRHRGAAPLFCAVAAAAITGAAGIQVLFLGPAYRAAMPLFVIMGAATAITMFVGLANTLVHSLGIPEIETALNIIRLVVLSVLLLSASLSATTVAVIYSIVLVSGEMALFGLVFLRERQDAGKRTYVADAA